MTAARTPARRHLAPLLGWLVVLAAALLSVLLTDDSVWARGVLAAGGEITATQGVLVSVPDHQPTIVLAFGGLGTATFFGLAAVPWSRATRWVLTAVVAALVLAGVLLSLTEEQDASTVELVGALVVSSVPAAVLLLLVWLRLRRTSAGIAVAAVVVGAIAHVVTLLRLLGSDGSPAVGAWAMAGVLFLGLVGSLAVRRSVARVSP